MRGKGCLHPKRRVEKIPHVVEGEHGANDLAGNKQRCASQGNGNDRTVGALQQSRAGIGTPRLAGQQALDPLRLLDAVVLVDELEQRRDRFASRQFERARQQTFGDRVHIIQPSVGTRADDGLADRS